MQEVTTTSVAFPSTSRDALTEILRQGAQAMLTTAIEAEVAHWIGANEHLRDERGHRQVVRNGYLPERSITTGIGPVKVRQPRVLDRRASNEAEPFSSKILPPYLRKTRSIEELLPWLYLKGISTGDFNEALQALVGPECPGLSASTITRLLEGWRAEYQEWSKRSLAEKHYVYWWVDGIHFNIRLEEDRQCILVLMGATADGKKELIAIVDGYRESEQSLEGTSFGREVARPGDRSQVGHRRRRLGILESRPPSLPRHARRSAAGSIRRLTCSTSYPSDYNLERRTPSMKSGWPRRVKRQERPSIPSWKPTARNTRRPVSAWPRTVTSCSPSTTSRPSTGSTSGRPTRSRASSPPCAYATNAPRAAAHAPPASRWSTN